MNSGLAFACFQIVLEAQMFELATQNHDRVHWLLPPQLRFISLQRRTRPVMERLERRHFFSAGHHHALPPAPAANLPAGTPLAAVVPNASAHNLASPAPTAAPAAAQSIAPISILSNQTADILAGGQSDQDVVALR